MQVKMKFTKKLNYIKIFSLNLYQTLLNFYSRVFLARPNSPKNSSIFEAEENKKLKKPYGILINFKIKMQLIIMPAKCRDVAN